MFGKRFLYGAAYYPEHWDRSLWRRDARLMRQAGFNTVRVGEFAWCFLEPQEGQFDFAWLDEALDVLAGEGIRAIVGTPTATIPAWMAAKYPDVMLASDQGVRKRFGIRKDYCYSHPDFQRLALRIVEKVAEHFGRDRRVIAFQTDNEFGGSRCRCGLCLERFRAFLKARYRTVGRMNREHGNAFWGMMYNRFDDVAWPPEDYPNPSFNLDWKRFASDVDVQFQRRQVAILRRLAPAKPITHNYMGLYPGIDYYALAEDLDFISLDSYPGADTAGSMHAEAMGRAVTWSMKRKNFIMLEQQSGPGGWTHYAPQTAPGETAMLAWQSIARGADGVLYFRWRTSISGQEEYWHGIINHDNVPRRRYREVAELGRVLPKLARAILGTVPIAEVGVYNNYDQIWATQYQPQNRHDAATFGAVLRDVAEGLTGLGADFGAFGDGRDLRDYRLVVCPPLYLTDPALVRALAAYVRGGGHVVLTARSGAMTINNKCVMQPLPGAFAKLAGVEVEEYAAIGPDADWQVETPDGRIKAGRIREWLVPGRGTRVVGVHRGHYMDGQPAITCRNAGKGKVWYVGTLPSGPDWKVLLKTLLPQAGASFRDDLPQGVEAARRRGSGRELTFLINHTARRQVVNLAAPAKDLLTARKASDHLTLDPYAVAVLNRRL